jgi:hypothetical protein
MGQLREEAKAIVEVVTREPSNSVLALFAVFQDLEAAKDWLVEG